MKKFYASGLFLALALIVLPSLLSAQSRYIDEIFSSYQLVEDTTYGTAPGTYSNPTNPEPLLMDLYLPPGSDTATNRPVVIMNHAGSFLEASNQPVSPLSTKDEFFIIDLAERLARSGYVVAAVNYRVGWNPVGDADTRERTIIQAAYRAVQDGKGAVRMFKKSFVEDGNPYQIDTNRIVVLGTQSGGYVPLQMAFLDEYPEVLNNPRLQDGNGVNFIDTTDLGNFEASGDHQQYSSRFDLIVSLAGAVLDTTLMKGYEDIPVIAMHGNEDDVTPYATDIVRPAALGGTPITEVSGSFSVVQQAERLGLQTPVENIALYQPGALPGNLPNLPGLYTFFGEGFQPYAWYDNSTQPEIDAAKLFIDTVYTYITTGMAEVLALQTTTSTPEAIGQSLSSKVQVYPVPATTELNIGTRHQNIQLINATLMDVSGRRVAFWDLQRQTAVTGLDISGYERGVYLLDIQTEEGRLLQKIVLR